MSAQSEQAKVGLLSVAGDEVPLLGVRVAVTVRSQASRVRVEQRYRNDGAAPLEAVYVFPLEDESAIHAFEVQTEGRTFRGIVRPRDEAFEAYDEAMEEGHGAYLLEQERPNLFTANVGNLRPGQEATLALEYVAELTREGPAIRLSLPTTVAPRYVSLAERAEPVVGQRDDERVNPPLALTVPSGLNLTVEARLGQPIAKVGSPSHPIEFELDGERAVITLATESAALNRDFVLLLTPATPAQPEAVWSREESGTVAMVAFRPEFGQRTREPREVIFVIDCSGSMAGSSIEQARLALRLCLRQLELGDRFNVVRFGSRHESFWPEPRAYDEASLNEAEARLERMEADLGGTEILAPLADVLRRPTAGNRDLLLMTDGQVSNDRQVIALARKHRQTTRVFGFGIGAGVNQHLVRGISRVSGGKSEFIHPGERIEPKVLRQFARLGSPQVRNLRLKTTGRVVPEELPPVFDTDALVAFVRFDGPPPATVKLRGDGPDGALEWTVALPPEPMAESLLGVLCARRELEALEDSSWTSGSQQEARKQTIQREAITALALRYGLMSSATSFVVIEQRPEGERVVGPARLIQVPSALVQGWGGMPMILSAPRAASGESFTLCERADSLPAPRSSAKTARTEPVESHRLLLSQSFDGHWELDAELLKLLGVSAEDLQPALSVAPAPVVATRAALLWLEREAAADKAEWALAADKAERWLAQQGPEPQIAGVTLTDWLRDRLT